MFPLDAIFIKTSTRLHIIKRDNNYYIADSISLKMKVFNTPTFINYDNSISTAWQPHTPNRSLVDTHALQIELPIVHDDEAIAEHNVKLKISRILDVLSFDEDIFNKRNSLVLLLYAHMVNGVKNGKHIFDVYTTIIDMCHPLGYSLKYIYGCPHDAVNGKVIYANAIDYLCLWFELTKVLAVITPTVLDNVIKRLHDKPHKVNINKQYTLVVNDDGVNQLVYFANKLSSLNNLLLNLYGINRLGNLTSVIESLPNNCLSVMNMSGSVVNIEYYYPDEFQQFLKHMHNTNTYRNNAPVIGEGIIFMMHELNIDIDVVSLIRELNKN